VRFYQSAVTVVQVVNGRWLALCVHVCGRGGCDLYVNCVTRNVAVFLLMRLGYVRSMFTTSLCTRSRWLKRLRVNKTPGNIRKVI
jgi:hypothetical protein